MFFDIGMGLFLTTFVGFWAGLDPSWTLLTVGLVGSLWPDLDFIVWVVRGNKLDHLTHRHRELLHRPLFFVPLLATVVWLWLGSTHAILFASASMAHVLHDSVGHGWGTLLLWPLDDRYWCVRSYGNKPFRLYVWTRSEQDRLCDEYGDHEWMRHTYGRISWSLVIELTMLMTGVAIASAWYMNLL